MEKEQTPMLLLMIDFENAFDSVVYRGRLYKKHLIDLTLTQTLRDGSRPFTLVPHHVFQSMNNTPNGLMYKEE